MVVNARSAPRTDWDREEEPPGFVSQLLQSSIVPIDRYSFETVETMKDRVEIFAWRRELLVSRARLAGATEAEAIAKADAILPNLILQVMDIGFDTIPDPQERSYLMKLPTSFVLPPEDVDRLREAAGQIVRSTKEYQEIVREFGVVH